MQQKIHNTVAAIILIMSTVIGLAFLSDVLHTIPTGASVCVHCLVCFSLYHISFGHR